MKRETDRDYPMAPKIIPGRYGDRYEKQLCARCLCEIQRNPEWNFCPICGQAITPMREGRRMTQEEYDRRRAEAEADHREMLERKKAADSGHEDRFRDITKIVEEAAG